jgi:[acyl-carrier-protein] S-malonyltransferase
MAATIRTDGAAVAATLLADAVSFQRSCLTTSPGNEEGALAVTIAYFIGRAGRRPEDLGNIQFFDAYPHVRALYRDISEWTGLSVQQILAEEIPPDRGTKNSMLMIRCVAGQLAVHDTLVEQGIRPAAIVGLSLGITSASVMSGSLGRRALFEMLWYRRNGPEMPRDAEPQGVALCRLRPGRELKAHDRDGIYLGVDFGMAADGSGRRVALAGYRRALEKLSAEDPENVAVLPEATVAGHTPLRRKESDFVREYLSTLEFTDPDIPLSACLEPRLLTRADEVRDAIWRNIMATASLPHGFAHLSSLGIRLFVIPGPLLLDNLINFPLPAVPVNKPDDIEVLKDKMAELGIQPATAPLAC